jgi:uncharacterized membrane protein
MELHPAVVHFPIALAITSALFILLYRLFNREALLTAAEWTFDLAALSSILAVISGLLAEGEIKATGSAAELLENHELIGILAMCVLAGGAILRRLLPDFRRRWTTWYLLVFFLAAILVGINGYLGGEMVFRHGLGIELHDQSIPSP